jgi:hypothetical protein
MGFWDFFWLMLIYIPLVMVWATALVDVFRRDDIGGVGKALWTVAIFVLPFIGTLIYLIARPAGATKGERVLLDEASRAFVERYSPSDRTAQLAVLADLRERGALDDAEFATEKARILTGEPLSVTVDGQPAPV